MALATPHKQILQLHLYYKNSLLTKAKKHGNVKVKRNPLIFHPGIQAKMTSAMCALIRLAHGFPPGKTIDPDVVGEE